MKAAEIREKILNGHQLWAERALVAIWKKQTADEQNSSETKESNGVGFSGCDARMGSYYAKWILSGRNLTGPHLERGRRIAAKYSGQLEKISEGK